MQNDAPSLVRFSDPAPSYRTPSWAGFIINTFGFSFRYTQLEFYKKLIAFLPPDVPAWDDASNNKWLMSGRGALIMNPPSAWAVAKRDAPEVAEQCWTHGFPAGPKGRFAPYTPFFWAIWAFSKNKEAAKSLLAHLSQPSSIEKLVVASGTCRPTRTLRR